MLLRALLEFVLIMLVARAFWRLLGGVVQGMSGRARSQPRPGPRGAVPERGVHMERDPVCGTFVVPNATLSTADGRTRVYFCSTTCRDKYRARTA